MDAVLMESCSKCSYYNFVLYYVNSFAVFMSAVNFFGVMMTITEELDSKKQLNGQD